MIKQLFQRLELHFWDWITPRMSESTGVGRLVQQVYTLTHDTTLSLIPAAVLVSAVMGLILGWIIGSLGVRIW